ncbi:MAG: tRNA-dihydrouridine synthase, partial [Burkholderiales bacterium]|nr:tRNA-dihydrouridine synthase [Burkholderiales bacterium]
PPTTLEVKTWLIGHLADHLALYGEQTGVRSARKHIGWAVHALPGGAAFRAAMNRIDEPALQVRAVADYFDALAERHVLLPAANDEGPDFAFGAASRA